MASFALAPQLFARIVIIVATAMAMLLPLSARCAACSTSAGDCPRCIAANTQHQTSAVERACCKHRTARSDKAFDGDSAGAVSNHSPHCGCGVRPLHRTVPTKDQLLIAQDFAAAEACLFETSHLEPRIAAVAASNGDLPPPLPHRILYCCWLI
jgi:hypothetical protein